MEICVLGSGSSGNCTYVEADGTRILIDTGVRYKYTVDRLKQLDATIESIDGVLFTHDHSDHREIADILRRRHALPFYANEGTAIAIEVAFKSDGFAWNIFENGSSFSVGNLIVEPFSVPHDAADPVGFVISNGNVRLGVITDLGVVTPLVESKLLNCDVLILEVNYDPEMLIQSDRWHKVNTRTGGASGHLSNEDAADLLERVLCPQLRTVFLVHLSSECNTPFLAESALRGVLKKAGREDIQLVQTYANRMSERIEI